MTDEASRVKMQREAREKMTLEERQVNALETIAEQLVQIKGSLVSFQHVYAAQARNSSYGR